MATCMEYINIISKEDIMAVPNWLMCIGGAVSIAAILSVFVYLKIVKDLDKAMRYIGIVGTCAIAFCILFIAVTNCFCRVPTGKYRYKATIDKDNITVSQYEEFIEKYNPTIKDGVYYWQD